MDRVFKLAMFCGLLFMELGVVASEVLTYTPEADAVPDEYILTLKKDILTTQSEAWVTNFAASVAQKYECSVKNHFAFDQIQLFRVKGSPENIQKLWDVSEVAMIEKNIYVRAIASVNNDVTVCYVQDTGRELWGLSRISRREKIPLDNEVDYSWGSVDDGNGVTAYILDSGIDVTHPDFEGRARWGFTGSSIKEPEVDYHGHGTHVAGTVGGRTYGVAKNVHLVAVKVLNKDGIGSMADVIEGIQFAYQDSKATESATGLKSKGVINVSLGGRGKVQAVKEVIDQVTAGGVTVVVAAGNGYDDACMYTPSFVPSAITVGATNINDDMSEFSNYGSCVDVLAPGEAILSTHLEDGTALFQGTSVASPHVAGVIARYLTRCGTVPSPKEITQMLLDDATEGKINLGGNNSSDRLATPNKLLYLKCGGPFVPPTPQPAEDGDSGIVWKSILSCVVFAICFVLSVACRFFCC